MPALSSARPWPRLCAPPQAPGRRRSASRPPARARRAVPLPPRRPSAPTCRQTRRAAARRRECLPDPAPPARSSRSRAPGRPCSGGPFPAARRARDPTGPKKARPARRPRSRPCSPTARAGHRPSVARQRAIGGRMASLRRAGKSCRHGPSSRAPTRVPPARGQRQGEPTPPRTPRGPSRSRPPTRTIRRRG